MPSARPGAGKGAAAAGQPWRAARRPQAAQRCRSAQLSSDTRAGAARHAAFICGPELRCAKTPAGGARAQGIAQGCGAAEREARARQCSWGAQVGRETPLLSCENGGAAAFAFPVSLTILNAVTAYC
jgi:hypothetical protein